jgi:glycerophosphoryl diester phosphodiesterase
VPSSAPGAGDPIGFAHRGGARGRQENTLAAFASALGRGATGLESDAWITADGQVVLQHDGVTGPLWHRRPISTQKRAELPARIPALPDLYEHCGTDFELSLDVKDPAALPAILVEARAAGAATRLWVGHNDWRWLAGWRAACPDVNLVLSARLARLEEGLAAQSASLRRAGVDVLNMHRTDWTADRVATVHASGIRGFGWDAQTHPDMVSLLRMGVDGLYSDHVDVLMAAIASERADR